MHHPALEEARKSTPRRKDFDKLAHYINSESRARKLAEVSHPLRG